MRKILNIFKSNIGVTVLLVAVISFFIPDSALWIKLKWINPLLMVVMFGMGLTITPKDFAMVFINPRDVICGSIAQFVIMPLIAYFLCYFFKLDPALSVGVVLVGTCPGGTASNVITFLAKGDVALSVGMTSVNTLLSPFLTPAITYLLLRTTVSVDVFSMFYSIVSVILVPIGLGLVINTFFKNFTKRVINYLPALSTIAICLIIASVVSHNAGKIYESGAIVFMVVILHNFFGFLFGFLVGKLLKMPVAKIKAISLEVGMQNSGLATSLATTSFPTLQMATVPGAIFSVWHNISGAIIASVYKRWGEKGKGR